MPLLASAQAPECPIFPNKTDCLKSVAQNYEGLIDFINRDLPNEKEQEMIRAAQDIKHFESQACEKTCLF